MDTPTIPLPAALAKRATSLVEDFTGAISDSGGEEAKIGASNEPDAHSCGARALSPPPTPAPDAGLPVGFCLRFCSPSAPIFDTPFPLPQKTPVRAACVFLISVFAFSGWCRQWQRGDPPSAYF
jgi:hypothetical protein